MKYLCLDIFIRTTSRCISLTEWQQIPKDSISLRILWFVGTILCLLTEQSCIRALFKQSARPHAIRY